MKNPTYSVRNISSRSAKGVTEAAYSSVNAILKFDCNEIPNNVYNEIVSTRLAQTLHIPIADGVLVSTGEGPAYASLMLASPGIPLPDINDYQLSRCADRYPDLASALVVFDIWIGNFDRSNNIKAALVTKHISLFRGYDHSHSLLSAEDTEHESISSLILGKLIAQWHPFYGLVYESHLSKWVRRICALPDEYVNECCQFDGTFRAVTEANQVALSKALNIRKTLLASIILDSMNIIRPRR